jgi:phosphopantetheinyl transferase (holo-ACP synthase)
MLKIHSSEISKFKKKGKNENINQRNSLPLVHSGDLLGILITADTIKKFYSFEETESYSRINAMTFLKNYSLKEIFIKVFCFYRICEAEVYGKMAQRRHK